MDGVDVCWIRIFLFMVECIKKGIKGRWGKVIVGGYLI